MLVFVIIGNMILFPINFTITQHYLNYWQIPVLAIKGKRIVLSGKEAKPIMECKKNP